MLTFLSIALVLCILARVRMQAAPRVLVRMNSDPFLAGLVDLLPTQDDMAWCPSYWNLWTYRQWETWVLWEAMFDGRLTPDLMEERR